MALPKAVFKAKLPAKARSTRLRGFCTIFHNQARVEAGKLTEDMANAILDEVKEAVVQQKYDWKPLNKKYKDWKIKHGLDPRTLIATKFYLEHMKVWKYLNRVSVGVPPRIRHPTRKGAAGVLLYKLARSHEFGYENIPARPHWRPAVSKVVRNFPKFRAKYYRNVKQNLKRAK